MDRLGDTGGFGEDHLTDDWADEQPAIAPVADEADDPPMFGGDERRMQVRAYHFWTRLLGDTNFPLLDSLVPDDHPDFAPNSVLIDFTGGIGNPGVSYLGSALAAECGGSDIRSLADVPARSLLSRITDHYLQIIANRAPIGFEAEYENQYGAIIMYRGILLPFSSNGTVIDYIYGVINWKERASEQVTAELQLEVASAMANAPRPAAAHAIWADGPDAPLDEAPLATVAADVADCANAVGDDVDAVSDYGDAVGDDAELSAEDGLADWVASARRLAAAADGSEGRSRAALYRALGRAYDVALVAAADGAGLIELLADAGIKAQVRSPMTAIAKLVFGAAHDKSRLTEYAAAMTHAAHARVGLGAMPGWIEAHDGGLKAVVKAARAARRAARGEIERPDPRAALRAAPVMTLDHLRAGSEEFVLLVARATDDGALAIIGRADGGAALLDRALRAVTPEG